MREREVERHLVRVVEELGGLCWKFTSPGLRGVPDRLVILPDWPIHFVETKRPNKTATPQQRRRHRELRALGVATVVLDSKAKIDRYYRRA
jgi:hypothetical protein